MNVKKFSDIKTKEDRQVVLNGLLKKELEKIRKKIYKYQRRNVLWNPITIEECNFDDYKTAGKYEYDRDEEEHRIYISEKLAQNYVNCKYSRWHKKKVYKEMLINTIGHEIVHGLVQEKFEHIFRKIEHKNRDASPVFLATLQFLNYTSSHDCASNYFFTKVWRDIQELKLKNAQWNEFLDYIFTYLKEIEEIRESFNKEHEYITDNNVLRQAIYFRFSSRDSGLHKANQSILSVKGYVANKKAFRNANIITTTFEIGSMMYSEKIKKLLDKKILNGVKADVDIINYKKIICNTETNYNRWVYEKEEIYNKCEETKKIAERIDW